MINVLVIAAWAIGKLLVESFGSFLGLIGGSVVEGDGIIGGRFLRLSKVANGFPKIFAST